VQQLHAVADGDVADPAALAGLRGGRAGIGKGCCPSNVHRLERSSLLCA
jgi:hypothetical protein